jgi:hypothetical protein
MNKKRGCLKSTFNHPVMTLRALATLQSGSFAKIAHRAISLRSAPFEKEGKLLIYSIITFSSSQEEEYPDVTSGGGGVLFKQSLFIYTSTLKYNKDGQFARLFIRQLACKPDSVRFWSL